MRNKADLDELSMDNLYNNLKVYEAEIKSQSSSSSNSHNVAFVSSDDTSSTNEKVNTAYEVSTANSQGQASSSSYVDDVMFSFFVSQSNREVTLLENRGHQGIRRNRNRDVPRIIVPVETTANALVVQDGIGGYDWSFQAEEGATDFSLMAHLSSGSSSSSSSNSEVRDNSITKLKNKLAEALREKDDLKLKLEKFETSSKKLTDLLNSQISVDNKIGIGFYSQMTKNELHDIHKNNSEVFVKGYHAVPPLYTGNYMPLRPDLSFAALDDSVYKTIMSETITSVPRNESTASMFSKDNLEQPKYVRPSAPITNRQAENLRKCQSPRVDKRNWNGLMTQKLGDGFGFNKKAFFVCGSLNHLIKDCNFYENKMVGKSMLNNMGRVTVLTKSGNVLVNTAKQSSSRAVVSNSIVRYVNTAATRPTMNDAKPKKVNTAKVNNVTTAGTKAVVSAVQGHEENSVKSSACWIWRPTGKVIDHISKDSGSYMPKRFDYVDPQGRLEILQDIDGGFVAFVDVLKDRKAFRVFNTRTKKVEENLHIKFLENKPNVAGSGPEWLFDIDSLTKSMNYEPVFTTGNQTNDDAGIETNVNAVQTGQEKASNHEYILLPFFTSDSQGPKSSDDELVLL
ncbi:hypothetical protein Tco_1473570 [Tanacetum coccineum]